MSAPQLITRQRTAAKQVDANLFGPPIIDDRRMQEVDRAAAGEPIAVTVVNTSGAGGLVSLARRSFQHLSVSGVETTVRDRDDPAGNVARMAAAARELEPDTAIYVGLPDDAGWQAACEEAEANGLAGLITGDDLEPAALAERMSGCVELDLPFRIGTRACSGIGASSDSDALVLVLIGLDRLIDGADVSVVSDVLAGRESIDLESIRAWGAGRIARVRRRLIGFDLPDPYTIGADLRTRGFAVTS